MTTGPQVRSLPGFDVSRETIERLTVYAELLERWNRKINLVSPSTIPDVWTRHFMDSAQLTRIHEASGHWADLGSGGGFPGMVVAILFASRDDVHVTLVESDQRKAAFLRTVSRETEISVGIVADRIERTAPLGANIISARALAPLKDLLASCERHFAPKGRALFLKGRNSDSEISEALESWRFDCEKHPSITDGDATVLSIGDIARV
jgi:16S rRNA (guanine527-N7)-methyltransferase